MVLGYIHLWEWGDRVQPITPCIVQMAQAEGPLEESGLRERRPDLVSALPGTRRDPMELH